MLYSIRKFFRNLFASRYTPWVLIDTVVESVEITKQVEDLAWSGGNGISDPLDVKTVGTGVYVEVKSDIYRKTHLKTGLPKYRKLKRP